MTRVKEPMFIVIVCFFNEKEFVVFYLNIMFVIQGVSIMFSELRFIFFISRFQCIFLVAILLL